MRRTIISAVVGVTLGIVAFTGIDTVRNLIAASQFGAIQSEVPSQWLLLEELDVLPSVAPDGPNLSFTATPFHDLLVRLTVSPRNVETGAVLCSGGGPTTLYHSGVAINVKSSIAGLAGLDNCTWPAGLYRMRLTFSMTEPDSQISKVMLVETEDVEVYDFVSRKD